MNGNGYFTGPRIILWLANALIMVFLYFSQQSLAELKGRQQALENTINSMAISIATQAGEQNRYARDIGEIKSKVDGMDKALQGLTLALERQQARLSERR